MSCSLNNKVIHPYVVIAYYYFSPIADVDKEVREHKEFLTARDVKSRIYIATNGINAQLSASVASAEEYIEWLKNRFGEAAIDFKLHPNEEHAFPRLTVKKRKELVALGIDVDMSLKGTYMTPEEWRKTLDDTSTDKIILDVRNDYEWKLGHFQDAYPFPCQTFREFVDSVAELKKRISRNTKVLMYCTGGIRCELFSSLLIQEGITDVHQLKGGVIRYGLEEKSKHWLGKLFVFDDRLSIPISDEKAQAVAHCHHCTKEAENYYNCANMDCNELFICCSDCLEQFQGCCKSDCMSASRVRPFQHAHKPFRRWYNYMVKKDGVE